MFAVTMQAVKNDPKSMGAGYVKSKNNFTGDSRRSHYGQPQGLRGEH